MQVDSLREELENLTNVCGTMFLMLQEDRPEDQSVKALWDQYEGSMRNISIILDDASARNHTRSEYYYNLENPKTSNYSRNASHNNRAGLYDKQSLLSFLKQYFELITKGMHQTMSFKMLLVILSESLTMRLGTSRR